MRLLCIQRSSEPGAAFVACLTRLPEQTTSQLLVRLLLEQLVVPATVSDRVSLYQYPEHIACGIVVDRSHEYLRACIHEEQMSRQSFRNGQSVFSSSSRSIRY